MYKIREEINLYLIFCFFIYIALSGFTFEFRIRIQPEWEPAALFCLCVCDSFFSFTTRHDLVFCSFATFLHCVSCELCLSFVFCVTLVFLPVLFSLPRSYFVAVFLCRVFYFSGARSLENLVEGHNWFLNQFVEIPRRSVIVCFLSLSAKAGLNLSSFEISCSWPPSRACTLPRFLPRFLFAARPWPRLGVLCQRRSLGTGRVDDGLLKLFWMKFRWEMFAERLKKHFNVDPDSNVS